MGKIIFFSVPKLSLAEDPTDSLSISSCYTSLLGLVTTLMVDGKLYLKFAALPTGHTLHRTDCSKHATYCLV